MNKIEIGYLYALENMGGYTLPSHLSTTYYIVLDSILRGSNEMSFMVDVVRVLDLAIKESCEYHNPADVFAELIKYAYNTVTYEKIKNISYDEVIHFILIDIIKELKEISSAYTLQYLEDKQII